MGDDKLRLFTAVRVPRDQLEWLDREVAGLKTLAGARWTDVDNQHVTLNFLGWVEARLLPDVIAALDGASGAHPPAEMSLTGLGAFPRARRARVLWAGIADPADLLPALARDLGERLRAVGYEPEDRPFTAHLTLARLKEPRPIDLPDLPPSPGSFTVDRVTLFRSRLSPAGARYEVVHEAYLSASATDAEGSQ
jgi:2'-5' RNA ligase